MQFWSLVYFEIIVMLPYKIKKIKKIIRFKVEHLFITHMLVWRHCPLTIVFLLPQHVSRLPGSMRTKALLVLGPGLVQAGVMLKEDRSGGADQMSVKSQESQTSSKTVAKLVLVKPTVLSPHLLPANTRSWSSLLLHRGFQVIKPDLFCIVTFFLFTQQ